MGDWSEKEERDPKDKKRQDYEHQRSSSVGGEGWRKVRSRLPKMERRLYRHAQKLALREAMSLEDGELEANDWVNGLKRKYFRLLRYRREIPLGKKVELRRGGVRRLMYWVPAGRKQGRKYLPWHRFIVLWIKRHGHGNEEG